LAEVNAVDKLKPRNRNKKLYEVNNMDKVLLYFIHDAASEEEIRDKIKYLNSSNPVTSIYSFEKIPDLLKKIEAKFVNIFSETDFASDESRMEMMMGCINLCYEDEDGETVLVEDNVFGVVLGVCFNYANIISNLLTDGFSTDEYYSFLKQEILPIMKEESKALPYWDFDNE
jgi:hypothetical protein